MKLTLGLFLVVAMLSVGCSKKDENKGSGSGTVNLTVKKVG